MVKPLDDDLLVFHMDDDVLVFQRDAKLRNKMTNNSA